ncbi:hypothetical protein PspLS_02331 [Pyricularia sp. CBS 133598]|nr:hypothetical protein PspLS_02331 [Pyricularia sp. CBS 133598]
MSTSTLRPLSTGHASPPPASKASASSSARPLSQRAHASQYLAQRSRHSLRRRRSRPLRSLASTASSTLPASSRALLSRALSSSRSALSLRFLSLASSRPACVFSHILARMCAAYSSSVMDSSSPAPPPSVWIGCPYTPSQYAAPSSSAMASNSDSRKAASGSSGGPANGSSGSGSGGASSFSRRLRRCRCRWLLLLCSSSPASSPRSWRWRRLLCRSSSSSPRCRRDGRSWRSDSLWRSFLRAGSLKRNLLGLLLEYESFILLFEDGASTSGSTSRDRRSDGCGSWDLARFGDAGEALCGGCGPSVWYGLIEERMRARLDGLSEGSCIMASGLDLRLGSDEARDQRSVTSI